jgi:predicted small secreted protein
VKKSEVYIYGVAMVVASFMIVFLGGCGNTISGVGKDITQVGDKVTAWQNEEPTEKVVEKKTSK